MGDVKELAVVRTIVLHPEGLQPNEHIYTYNGVPLCYVWLDKSRGNLMGSVIKGQCMSEDDTAFCGSHFHHDGTCPCQKGDV